MTCKNICITALVTCKKIGITALVACKKICITALGPVLDYGLYYFDIFTDAKFALTMKDNCHQKFFRASVSIAVTSYLLTVCFLRYHLSESWKRAFLYPYLHGSNLWNHMKRNFRSIYNGQELPEEPEEEKRYGHYVSFFEATTESVLQLSISCLLLREFGLSPNDYDRFNQLSGLGSSLMSIVLLFSKVRTKDENIFLLK